MSPNRKEKSIKSRKKFQGFMLIEVLVAILIFALGIVALISLQARMLGTAGDVQYRVETINLMNEYMAGIWAYGGTVPDIMAMFGDGGDEHTKFVHRIQAIPGGDGLTVGFANTRTETIGAMTINSADVSMTITWRDTKDPTITHEYSQISSFAW